MFNVLSILRRKERKIDIQLQVFLKWRKKKGMSLSDYSTWLKLFIDRSTKDDILDITAVDVLEFVEHIRVVYHNSQFALKRAEIALRQFKRFYSARTHLMTDIADYNKMLFREEVNFIVDTKRNKDLVMLRLADRKTWTYRALGERFNIHYTRAKQIFDANVNRYSHL